MGQRSIGMKEIECLRIKIQPKLFIWLNGMDTVNQGNPGTTCEIKVDETFRTGDFVDRDGAAYLNGVCVVALQANVVRPDADAIAVCSQAGRLDPKWYGLIAQG